MAKRGSRERVERCVIEYAKTLDSATLPYAHVWYNMDERQWCYMRDGHMGVVFADQVASVQSTTGDNILIVLPLCATRYTYYKRVPAEPKVQQIASTYV
jgi:hypothetical protein